MKINKHYTLVYFEEIGRFGFWGNEEGRLFGLPMDEATANMFLICDKYFQLPGEPSREEVERVINFTRKTGCANPETTFDILMRCNSASDNYDYATRDEILDLFVCSNRQLKGKLNEWREANRKLRPSLRLVANNV